VHYTERNGEKFQDYIDIKIIACYKGLFNQWSKTFMREKTEKKNNGEHIPSSCKLVLEMLANPPEACISIPLGKQPLFGGTIKTSYKNSENLARAYIACQNRLEISPLLSTSEYSIFVTPEKAGEHAAEAKVLQQHGKFSTP